jgi:hypothetical protein
MTLHRLARETRAEHMGAEVITEAEAVLDRDDETPEDSTTDDGPS